MTKADFYAQLPRIIKRLFTLGLGASTLFWVIWYFGGLNLWGHLLGMLFGIFSFFGDIEFSPGTSERAAFLYHVGGIEQSLGRLTFPVNRLNSSMAEVITLLAVWPHRDIKAFFKLSAWCLVLLTAYQMVEIWFQFYAISIGPDLAGRQGVFWEETAWYRVVKSLSSFVTLILRYWAGFPIFLAALVANWFFNAERRTGKDASKKKNKA